MIGKKGCRFDFRYCAPSDRSYFIYSPRKGRDFYTDYHLAREKYGMGTAKSELNKTDRGVFEIDPKKAEPMLNSFFISRDRYFLKRCAAWIVLCLIYTGLFACGFIFAPVKYGAGTVMICVLLAGSAAAVLYFTGVWILIFLHRKRLRKR